MQLCPVCEQLTLEKLSDGFHCPEYSYLEASEQQCKLCRLILHALKEENKHPWRKRMGPETGGGLTVRAVKELPFALLPAGESSTGARGGLRITHLDIIHEHRVCGQLSVFAYEDDPLAEAGDLVTRNLAREAQSPQLFEKISSWISNCDTKHSLCTNLRQSVHERPQCDEPPLLPSRVLDLDLQDGSRDVRLLESCGRRGRYAALSHCWGTAPQIMTTTKTIASHRDRIGFMKLSPTFRDAVTIARNLKLQFLWIDSLCIIQDDVSDWELESAQMGHLYRNAVLTIAAAGAKDGMDGCFVRKSKQVVEPVYFRQTSSSGVEGAMYIGSYHGDFVSSVTSGPLNDRGWVLQERVLSSRTIHFARDQVFWECDQVTLSEDGRAFFHSDSLRHILSPHPSMHLQYLASAQSESQFFYDRWYSLVESYTSRKLSQPDDIFPALSGVVNEAAKLLNDEYLAGLWRNCLHVGLLWQSKGANWTRLPRPVSKRAPSWSWAVVEGPVSYLSSSRVRYTSQDFSALTIHKAHCVVVGLNPNGRIHGGQILLTGSLKQAWLDPGDQPGIPGVEIQSPKGHLVGTGYLDAVDAAKPDTNVSVLKICRSAEKDEPGLFWFVLLLRRTANENSAYERIGMGKITKFAWLDDAVLEQIVLI